VCMELRDTIGAAPLKITPIPFMRFPKLVLRTLGVCYGLLMWNGMINRIRSALSVPQAYQLFWHAVAGPRYIRTLVEEHIRPNYGMSHSGYWLRARHSCAVPWSVRV